MRGRDQRGKVTGYSSGSAGEGGIQTKPERIA